MFYLWRLALKGSDLKATWAFDVVVLLGVAMAAAGARVMAHLGASWAVWLLLWWLWCAGLVGVCRRRLAGWRQVAGVAMVGMVVPVIGGVVPFTVGAIKIQKRLTGSWASVAQGRVWEWFVVNGWLSG